jgi:hypothetical protein
MGGRDGPKVIGAGLSRRAWLEKGTLFVIIIAFIVIFSIASGGKYASPLNLMNILIAASLTGIVSIVRVLNSQSTSQAEVMRYMMAKD